MGQKLNKLTEVWVCTPTRQNIDGEYTTVWNYKNISKNGVHLNLQQDLNELDRNTAGKVDYDIQKARTTLNYNIEKGDGICLTDISESENIIPDYEVTDTPVIGNTHVFILKKYHGE